MKLWVKLIIDNKLVKDAIYKSNQKINDKNFLNALIEICYGFDCPTPMVLQMHINHLTKFNTVTFKVNDFIETFDFDKMIIESYS